MQKPPDDFDREIASGRDFARVLIVIAIVLGFAAFYLVFLASCATPPPTTTIPSVTEEQVFGEEAAEPEPMVVRVENPAELAAIRQVTPGLGEFVGHLGQVRSGGHYYRNPEGRCHFCPFRDTPECAAVRFAHPHPLEEKCLDFDRCRPVGCNPTGPPLR